MTKLVTILAAVLAVGVLVAFANGTNERYDFVYDIGDVVTYEGHEWEVVKLVESKEPNGIFYPFYKLSREEQGVPITIEVWACPIETENSGMEGECCAGDPPPCEPQPC